MKILEQAGNKKENDRIPESFVYEMIKGCPVYYRDYDKVLSGEKTLEEIMGSSLIQMFIITKILELLYEEVDKQKYIIGTNEVGIQFAPKSYRSSDIVIFDKNKVKDHLFSDKYAPVPPEVVIEIDTKADMRKFSGFFEYMSEKTHDLLDFGTAKVIWILTKEKKVIVAEKSKRWFITEWDDEIEVIEDIKLSLQNLIAKP